MKTSENITITDGRMKKALKKQVDPIVMPTVNKKIAKAMDDSKLQIGVMTKFYPYLDKCEVKLKNNKLVLCSILHRFSGELIEFYTPSGDDDYCEKLKEPCIIPISNLNCLVLDVNDDTNEQIMMGFVNLEEIIGLDPASKGSFKLASISASNEYWINFGGNGLDIRLPKNSTTSIGEYEDDMTEINVDSYSKNELDELLNSYESKIANLEEIINQLQGDS